MNEGLMPPEVVEQALLSRVTAELSARRAVLSPEKQSLVALCLSATES